MEKESLLAAINNIYAEIIEIHRDFHKYPELSEQESRTAKKIAEYLSAMGIEYEENIAGNGILGLIKGGKEGKTVALRAEMDALPIAEAVNTDYKSENYGIMHACGHDIHMAILLGTAKILNQIKSEFCGAVKFIFQPAEETVGGARQMIKRGCLENPKTDTVIGLHINPDFPIGTAQFKYGIMNAASCEFEVHITGRSCHGASPQKGIDALLIACEIVCQIQSIVSRRLPAVEPAVISVGKFNSGIKNNIVSDSAVFSGIIRTVSLKQQNFIKTQICKLAENISRAFGAFAEVTFCDSYPPLINNSFLVDLLLENAKKTLGRENVFILETPSMGADDFAYFGQFSEAAYFTIGAAVVSQEISYPLHSEYFNPDEASIKTGILLEVSAVLAILSQ